MNKDWVNILYIAGYPRSGSTLLTRILGRIEGFINVGELRHIWIRGFAENQLCGCGHPFGECEFWQAVVEEAFGGFGRVKVDEMIALVEDVLDDRSLLFLLFPSLRTARYQENLRAYSSVCNALYKAIQKVSGSSTVVESSKSPRYAIVLKEVFDVDLHILHLIRDSRGIAYSWQRKKIRPEVHWQIRYMKRYSVARSSLNWNLTNILMETLKNTSVKYITARYEDLANSPSEVISKIAAFLGATSAYDTYMRGESAVYLAEDHMISGNPNRFQKGIVNIRADTEWQHKMARNQKYIVTTLTWPLLFLYGYLGSELPILQGIRR